MASDCLVSVIIPAYNAAEFIEQCLNSLITQSLEAIEIIVVDDGSTDATPDLVESFIAMDSRIRMIRQSNQYAGIARNAGMTQATGKYLSFLDADDFFEPDMLESMVALADEYETDIVMCGSDTYEDATGDIDDPKSIRFIEYGKVFTPEETAEFLFQITKGWAWDKLFRRSFISRYDLKFQGLKSTNDAFFVYVALALSKNYIVTDRVFVHHRVGNSGSIENTRWKTWENTYLAFEAIEAKLREFDRYGLFEKSFIRFVLEMCVWNLFTLSGDAGAAFYQRFLDEWIDRIAVSEEDHYIDPSVLRGFAVASMRHFDFLQDYVSLQDQIYELQQFINTVQEEKMGLHGVIDGLHEENAMLQRKIDEITDSYSYKIGRAMTYLPRTVLNTKKDNAEHE